MSNHRKRPQRSKAERERVEHVQNLRRGSTTDRHASASDYKRKPKHPGQGWQE